MPSYLTEHLMCLVTASGRRIFVRCLQANDSRVAGLDTFYGLSLLRNWISADSIEELGCMLAVIFALLSPLLRYSAWRSSL